MRIQRDAPLKQGAPLLFSMSLRGPFRTPRQSHLFTVCKIATTTSQSRNDFYLSDAPARFDSIDYVESRRVKPGASLFYFNRSLFSIIVALFFAGLITEIIAKVLSVLISLIITEQRAKF
ncbi:MAG: hypothetical protein KGZ86_02430 [Candidatus Latescibacteria bacterium]|nr:hypothetical protein [Candidatus Latescibacterota bacterium]